MMTRVPEGTVILREGEESIDMYKILSGRVELYRGYGTGDEAIIGIKSKDDYFGETGLLTGGKPALYTVVAYSDVLLLRITQTDIEDYIQKNHVDILRIMQSMANTMYNIKYSMDMIMDDMSNRANNEMLSELRSYYSKQLALYNAAILKSSLLKKTETGQESK